MHRIITLVFTNDYATFRNYNDYNTIFYFEINRDIQ